MTMSELNYIGIRKEEAEKLAEKLNGLLADYQVLYLNARGFHWNIKGEKFFELHLKFEELYNNLILKIDEIAERILTLGFVPQHSFDDYLKTSEIVPEKNVTDGKLAVKSVLSAFSKIITKQRELLELSGEANDEGTNALMSDYIREQEKMVWMYTAFLG
jgi:starvation-inducible DNA-binding protein